MFAQFKPIGGLQHEDPATTHDVCGVVAAVSAWDTIQRKNGAGELTKRNITLRDESAEIEVRALQQ